MSAQPTLNSAKLTPLDRTVFRLKRASKWIENVVAENPGGVVIAFPVAKIRAAPPQHADEGGDARRARLRQQRRHRAIVVCIEPRGRRRQLDWRPSHGGEAA